MEVSYIGKQSVSRFSLTDTLDFTCELLYWSVYYIWYIWSPFPRISNPKTDDRCHPLKLI